MTGERMIFLPLPEDGIKNYLLQPLPLHGLGGLPALLATEPYSALTVTLFPLEHLDTDALI
jgi:hypothetical protein